MSLCHLATLLYLSIQSVGFRDYLQHGAQRQSNAVMKDARRKMLSIDFSAVLKYRNVTSLLNIVIFVSMNQSCFNTE